jgi:hypothetical protein
LAGFFVMERTTVASFKDRTGHAWNVDLNVGLMLRIKRETGINLAGFFDKDSKDFALLLDPEKLVQVTWLFVETAAVAAKIEPEAFAARLDGDSLDEIADAIGEAVADFFPRSRGKKMRRVLEKSRELKTAMDSQAEEGLAKMEQMPMDEMIGKAQEWFTKQDAKRKEPSMAPSS